MVVVELEADINRGDPGLPAVVILPVGVATIVVALVWFVALRIDGIRSVLRGLPVRIVAFAVFGLLTGLGLLALGNDVREIL